MPFSDILPVLTLLLGAAISYFTSGLLAHRQLVRTQRVEYLVSAYRTMAHTANRHMTSESARKLENAVADVYLFGTLEQQKILSRIIDQFAATRQADTDDILDSLRKSLRSELRLGDGLDRPVHLRINL